MLLHNPGQSSSHISATFSLCHVQTQLKDEKKIFSWTDGKGVMRYELLPNSKSIDPFHEAASLSLETKVNKKTGSLKPVDLVLDQIANNRQYSY